MAADPEGPAAALDHLRILQPPARRRPVRNRRSYRVMADRERVGREASPGGAFLDSQGIEATESGGPRGYETGKKVDGRKRQALVDADRPALVLDPQPADIGDRDGAVPVLRPSRRTFPFNVEAFADAGWAGNKPARATRIAVDTMRRPEDPVGFAAHPRRRIAERVFARISRNRRLRKDCEATIESAGAFPDAATILIVVRRLGRST